MNAMFWLSCSRYVPFTPNTHTETYWIESGSTAMYVNEFALWCSHSIKWNHFRMTLSLNLSAVTTTPTTIKTVERNFFYACGFGFAYSSFDPNCWLCYFKKRVRVAYFAGSFVLYVDGFFYSFSSFYLFFLFIEMISLKYWNGMSAKKACE